MKQSQTQPKVYDFSESEAYSKLPDGQTATINSSSNTYYRMTAANFSVNKDVMNDVSLFATSTDYVKTDSCDIVDELKKLQSEKTVYRGDKAKSSLRQSSPMCQWIRKRQRPTTSSIAIWSRLLQTKEHRYQVWMRMRRH